MDNPRRILFVDDEPSIRTLLAAILQQRGFAVTAAGTVSEALNLIATQTFDVLLSDLNIGEAGDGFTVVSAMRRTQPGTATFILTGYPAFESALEAIRQQVDDYFVKPADVEGLVARIQARLSGPVKETRRIEVKRLADLLKAQKAEIFSRWLAAAKTDDQIHGTVLSDPDLADHLPLLIDELVSSVSGPELSARGSVAAQRYGRARFQQGCAIPSLIREARILHEVLGRIVSENLLAVEVSSLITGIMAMGETIQAFLEDSIRSFLHARHELTQTVPQEESKSLLLLSADRELSLLREHALRHAGFAVARADSRPEALRLLDRPFEALVISCSISIESIAEFTAAFRQRNASSPIVGVTKGNWQDLKSDIDFSVNGDDGPEALIETIETAVNRKQLRRVR